MLGIMPTSVPHVATLVAGEKLFRRNFASLSVQQLRISGWGCQSPELRSNYQPKAWHNDQRLPAILDDVLLGIFAVIDYRVSAFVMIIMAPIF